MSGGTIAPGAPQSSLTLLRLFADHPGAFWRHDVDLSLAKARQMATVAELAGVQSTFYLSPRCDNYNLFASEGRYTVAHILNSGHRLGVHVEAALGDPEQDALNDLALAEAWYGRETFGRRVSFHMPPRSVLWRDYDGFENAYGTEWEDRYRSDSRGVLPDLGAVGDGDGWQINLHPEWWDL